MKRRVLLILLCLLLGAVVNLVTVWLMALLLDLEFEGITEGRTLASAHVDPAGGEVESYLFVNRLVWHDHAVVFDFRPRRDPNPVQYKMFVEMHEGFVSDAPDAPPAWAKGVAESAWKAEQLPGQRVAIAFGWPMRAAWFQCQASDPTVVRGGLFLEYDPTVNARSPARTLPLTPIWPGALVNTIAVALLIWLLIAAPRFIRRQARRRRGQCPACAYPVGASAVCTECGERVERH